METAKKEEGRRTRARKEQKEEEREKKGTKGGGGEGKKKRVSRWWRSRGISTRFVHAGNLSGLPSGRAFVITWAYGEHKRLGCTHVRLPRTRARACACVCVCAAIRACWEEELYTRCPPCAAINYRVTRYGRARPTLYISRKTCRRRYLKCGFLYGFSYPRITRSNFSSTISSMRGDVFTGKINSFEIYIYYQSYAQVLLVTSLMEGNIDTFRMLKVKRRGGIICS